MNVPTEPSLRGRPRDPKRREAILRAAIELVGEVGYDRMTVEALANRAGVSKPTIYRRWPGGKKDIVIDAIRTKHEAADTLPDQGSLRDDVLAHERRRLDGLLARAVERGELSADARVTPLFHDIAGSLVFARAAVTGEPL